MMMDDDNVVYYHDSNVGVDSGFDALLFNMDAGIDV